MVGAFALIFAGYVPLISENRCPIGVYFAASYRPDLSQSVLFAIPTWSALFMLLFFNGDSLLPIVLAPFLDIILLREHSFLHFIPKSTASIFSYFGLIICIILR